jgi:2,4-dienoyl-CoA reductase-like NADH-dependent reductase (Old Yellow Enzyme family)
LCSLVEGVELAELYQPFELAGMTLQNRFAMPPMTRCFATGGVPTAEMANYYARRASSLGLIVTEGVYIDEPSAGTNADVPLLQGEDALVGWRRVVDAVHEQGAKIFPQLWHLGAARATGSPPHPDAPVVSPSGIGLDGSPVGESAGKETIDAVVSAFARAAVNAKAIGFDGVEIHGAHGYLLDQFHWERTNRREDGYGGSLENRVRLSAEVVSAVRSAVGGNFPICFRFSQWKGGDYQAQVASNARELEAFLAPLVAAGVDIFHASTRRFPTPEFPGTRLSLAGWVKQLTGVPVIAVGSVGVPTAFGIPDGESRTTLSLAPVVDAFRRGEFDLVAVGRALLADPYWVQKVGDGTVEVIKLYDKDSANVLY